MEEFLGYDDVKVSRGCSEDNMEDIWFVRINMGMWVVGRANIHLVGDGAVKKLSLASHVKDNNGAAKEGKDQEHTTSVDKAGGGAR